MESVIQKGSVLDVRNGSRAAESLKKAADILLKGGAVVFPTESFYGLGVDMRNDQAVQRLFALKRRRDDHPILILIPSRETVEHYAENIPGQAHGLMDRFWPGGLTLIFQARSIISPLLTAGTGKIGIRLSSHPVATGLARAAGAAVTGTSANISGSPACTRAEEVMQSLGQEVDLILDGGETPGGKGSTILDVTVDPPRILREGIISPDRLREVNPLIVDPRHRS